MVIFIVFCMFTRGYLLSIGTVDVTRMPPAWALTSDIMRFDEACPFAAVDASKSGSHITILKPHQNRVSITWNVDLPEILGELPIFPAKTISIFGGHVPQRSHRNPLHPRPQATSAISCSALVVTSSESGDGTKTCAFASASSSNPVFFNMFFHYLNTYTHTHRQMDGWMDGWVGGWMDG